MATNDIVVRYTGLITGMLCLCRLEDDNEHDFLVELRILSFWQWQCDLSKVAVCTDVQDCLMEVVAASSQRDGSILEQSEIAIFYIPLFCKLQILFGVSFCNETGKKQKEFPICF